MNENLEPASAFLAGLRGRPSFQLYIGLGPVGRAGGQGAGRALHKVAVY